MNKNEIIIDHLTDMIANHNYKFETSLAQFMLLSLGKDFLETAEFKGVQVCNYTTKTSLYGLIKMRFCEADNTLNSDIYYETKGEYGKTVKASTQKKIFTEQSNFDKWANLLTEISPTLTQDSSCFISTWQDIIKVSYNFWFSLKNPVQWASNFINEPEKWKLSEIEEKILAKELISTSSKLDFSGMIYNCKDAEVSILLDIYLKHEKDLKKEYFLSIKKENSDKTEVNWTDRLFKSQNIKHLIQQGELEQVSQIFDEDSLKFLVKRLNIKTNVIQHPEMLSNLLPIAPPEKWIKAHSVKNKFNINTFFDNKFINGYTVSLTKDLTNRKSRYTNVQKALKDEISYLSPFLTSKYIKEEELINFWNKVIKIKDIDLFKVCARYIGLPDATDSFESRQFYHIYNTAYIEIYNKGVNEKNSLKELYLSERLEHSLQEKNEPLVRKIKI